LTLILKVATGLPFRFVFKSSNNAGIPGWMLRGVGGVPVDRQNSQGFVSQMVNAFDEHDPFMIAILPEGSRSKMPFWRTSFYYIALEAGVPIVLGYGDYRRKVVGLGPVITPTGDIEADFEHFARFYSGVTAKNPHKQGQVRLKPKEDQHGETE
jgi:1-acyl-sn-glycerol-3-phosphate acyltransferase